MIAKKISLFLLSFAMVLVLAQDDSRVNISLPAHEIKGSVSIEEALAKRRSVRNYKNQQLTMKELGQLLWAAQGITADWGGRTSPSAGATYPLKIYVAAGNVENIKPGLYQYIPESHALEKIFVGDIRKELCLASFGQKSIEKAPATIIIASDFSPTRKRYGERAVRYVYIEAGHVGQNIYLQAESLGLGTVAIGAFSDRQVKELLKIHQEVLYLMPVGRKT
ncbi:MAG: SagB/ThcOx family dehydrogenase [Candidatus Omnitrophica bacterium]|nr:SagB/ThcOx family dehydrogenase [Candidatus Omnitrophota bacterium]MCM8788609.1 SagB/ThcOx family dehydrogenase [Candidatus Omnitrophota bacterium]